MPARSPASAADGGDQPSLLVRAQSRIPIRLTIFRVILAITLLALVARVFLLGARTAHWDEARVAYWVDYYAETGHFAYRHIIHGPFVQHVDRWLFALFGPSDFLMRLPVAIVGGLLPLSAWLFRDHLRDDETVALALLLAFNAVLLYYSRFMRSDVLVGAFMFVALGMLVRLYDTGKWRYLYGMTAFLALGFASKENAFIYVLLWLGGTALLVDHALFRPRNYDSGLELLQHTWPGRFVRRVGNLRYLPGRLLETSADEARAELRESDSTPRRVLRYLVHPLGAVAVFVAVIVVMFAPRGAGQAGLEVAGTAAGNTLGLWDGILNPLRLPELVLTTLADTWEETLTWAETGGGVMGNEQDLIRFYGQQVAQDSREIAFFLEAEYFTWLGGYLEILAYKAPTVAVFGVLGFVYERFVAERSRNLVLFMGYGGLVSVIGYPLGTDIFGPWLAVHLVLPFTIPATVLLAYLYRRADNASVARDTITAAAAVFLLVLAAGASGMAVVGSVYTNDQSRDNNLVQYAQPADDLRPVVAAMGRIANADDQGADVLVYYGGGKEGSPYVGRQALVKNESAWSPSGMNFRPHCTEWFNLLPTPWYFAATEAEVTCAREPADLRANATAAAVPMIIHMSADATVPDEILEEEYRRYERRMRAWGYEMTFWVREDFVQGG